MQLRAGRPRMRLLGLSTLAVAALAGAGSAGAASGQAAPASSARNSSSALQPLRLWGGTEIRSLDPPAPALTRRRGGARAASAGAPPSGKIAPAQPPDEVLSNETTFTRWAYVDAIAPIRQRPTASSPEITELHYYTEDDFPEIYLALRAHWDASGQEWVLVRIPMRPNGRVGWVRRQNLGDFHLTHTEVVVSRTTLRMQFFDDGRLLWTAPVAVGKPSTPTPAGHFWIRERFKIEDPSSGYYPYAFGTSDYSTLTDWPGGGVVGIHGPYFQAYAIPGRISHGCIRLRVSDDYWLAGHIQLGTPVRVL